MTASFKDELRRIEDSQKTPCPIPVTNLFVRRAMDALDEGDAEAMTFIGMLHEHGRFGCAGGNAKALALYNEAAAQGDLLAKYNVAVMLADIDCYDDVFAELDGPQRYARSVAILQECISRNHVPSLLRLASAYENGVGVDKDDDAAVVLYRRAADSGNPHGLAHTARCYRDGIGVDHDENRYRDFLSSAANAGSPWACFALAGLMISEAGGIESASIDSIGLLFRAADLGHVSAMVYCADLLLAQDDSLVEHDLSRACSYLLQAVDAEDPDALAMYARLLASENTFPTDVRMARHYATQAADAGSREARALLGSL